MQYGKRFLATFSVVIGSILGSHVSHAQHASEGKAVVAHGFETSNEVRFGVLRPYDVGQWLHLWYEPVDSGYARVDRWIDSLGANATEDWPPVPATKKFYDRQRIICSGGPSDGNLDTNLSGLAWTIRQRIYTAAPAPIEGDDLNESNFRYNDYFIDSSHAKWHNNAYDSNDVSPYMEYIANHSFVDSKFHTLRYNNVDSLVYYGNEGRVVLGYSDDRDGKDLLTTPLGYPFRSNPAHFDTAKAFSVNLEFSLNPYGIDMTNAPNPTDTDHVPLVRLQVLYKKAGQSRLPFVPFTNGSDTNHGWFKCLDTVITRSVYNMLDTDWRAPDSTFDGSGGHRAHSWVFKQLHTIISLSDSMVATMKRQAVDLNTFGSANEVGDFGQPGAHYTDTQLWHPDSLVNYESPLNSDQLIEIRVLSTYRTNVRIRDVSYQDTMVDRYMNRKRFGDSTHSVNQNGIYGGNDSLVNAALAAYSSLMDTNRPREIMYNDFGGSPGPGYPLMGYLDYMGSKYQIYLHTRPQDGGDCSEYFRRSRLSLDGQPPSIFENQESGFDPNIIPYDYMYYGHKIETTRPWGKSPLDTEFALIARSGDTVAGGTDTLQAYKVFINRTAEEVSTFQGIRAMNRVAQNHPFSKRFATEYSIRTFVYARNNSYLADSAGHQVKKFRGFDSLGVRIRDSAYYNYSPNTPEMITTQVYGTFANGSSAVSAAEIFGNALYDWEKHDLGPFVPAPSADSNSFALYQHSVNLGHYYSVQQNEADGIYIDPPHTDQDGPLQPYYIGASNTYRALQRATSRMNAIWNQGIYPIKNFRWIDAYSQINVLNPTTRIRNYNGGFAYTKTMDSISQAAAFLKIDSTRGVNPWMRQGPDSAYIDLVQRDPDTLTMGEVGLFIDSSSTTQKNYAALIINSRFWPGRDTADVNYYNNGLDSINKMHPTLGDIDVRKVYLKLDLTKTNTTFASNTYFVVRDLWHPDSTWLLHRDSTFAVYIKPGDAKFLYFQPGIAIDVAAQAGTNKGQSTDTEFCFNNGRRIAEIEHGTKDIVTYTRGHKLYVAMPAAGSTFAGSPDQSSGDNIITGYEIPIDTGHFCARPSICVAQNDTGVALTYWYSTSSGFGKVVFAYRRTGTSSWDTVSYNTLTPWFFDTTYDHSWVTPVLTPINDTAWLIAAGVHTGDAFGAIVGIIAITPPSGLPYFSTLPHINLAQDMSWPIDTVLYASYPTLASRPFADTPWTVRFAYQQATMPHHHEIYFQRWKNLLSGPSPDVLAHVSEGLEACDNLPPSLATNGTIEQADWIKSGFSGNAKFYHDNLAWETALAFPTKGVYYPVVRVQHVMDSPLHILLQWGAFNVFHTTSPGYTYPQISADFRKYDRLFSSVGTPPDSSHDWIRMVYGQSAIYSECWAPNWMYSNMKEGGRFPTLPQTTNNPSSWPDSGSVPRSVAWVQNVDGNAAVRVTNGYMPRISHKNLPNLLLEASVHTCDTPTYVGPKYVTIQPPSDPPTIVNWDPIGPSFGDPDEAWSNPENIPNVSHTDAFAIQACDSIIIPRYCDTNGLAEIQDSLKSGSDYVMFRLKLLRKADSSWLGTIDSMIVTTSTIHWAGVSLLINADTARYEVPCTASPDSAFVSMEVLRGDTTNSIHRYYVNFLDTDVSVPAPKRATKPAARLSDSGLVVTVHPNPSSLTTKICIEDLPEGIPATVEIFNALGESITTLYNATPEAELGLCLSLDCSKLPSGTYYARVVNDIMGTTVKFSVAH